MLLALLLPTALAYVATGLPGKYAPARGVRLALAAPLGLGFSSCFYYLFLRLFGEADRNFGQIESALYAAGLAVLLAAVCGRKSAAGSELPLPEPAGRERGNGVAGALCAVAVACALGAFIACTAHRPHGGWDAFKIWNFRARFLFRGGSHWRDAFDPLLADSHADYPLLLPGSVARFWHCAGHDDTLAPALMALAFLFSAGALLYFALARRAGKFAALCALTLLCSNSGFAELAAMQYADVPLAVFALGGVALLSLADEKGAEQTTLRVLAGGMLGLACWTKNEGLLFALCLAAATFAWRWKNSGIAAAARESWLVLAGALPAAAVLTIFKLDVPVSNDIVGSQSLAACWQKLTDAGRWLEAARNMLAVSAEFGKGVPLALLAALGVILARNKTARAAVSPGLLALGLQLAAYTVIYVLTVLDSVRRHVDTSFDRLLAQLWPAFLFLFFLAAVGVKRNEVQDA